MTFEAEKLTRMQRFDDGLATKRIKYQTARLSWVGKNKKRERGRETETDRKKKSERRAAYSGWREQEAKGKNKFFVGIDGNALV